MADVIQAITKGLVKAPAVVDAVAPFGGGSLQALGRLFAVCASGRCESQQYPVPPDELLVPEPCRPADELLVSECGRSLFADEDSASMATTDVGCDSPMGAHTLTAMGSSALLDLAVQGPYLLIATFLDMASLSRADAVCWPLRDVHRVNKGAWCTLGAQAFLGLELEGEGAFEPEALLPVKHNRLDWKGRYARFLMEMRAFREPFCSAEITQVEHADEIAYSRIRLCTEVLASVSARGIYIEVEVLQNPDNVSLAVVNFDAGGCSSVTFSPDTGAVIHERKVCEEPRKVRGSYIQPLSTITQGQGFEGCMGLFLQGGQLAFFRRHLEAGEEGSEPGLGPWECTGFISDLDWADGKQLTPCLAFRDEGAYHVRIAHVGLQPPLMPERTAMAYDEANWNDLNWDADALQDLEEEEDEDEEEIAEL